MICFKVVVHGINREPTATEPDGSGFYTAQSVQADSLQRAIEDAFLFIQKDPRSTERGPLLRLDVEDVFEIDHAELGTHHGYIYY